MLISIGIMAIGMLSIAALIPVGGVQVNKANIEERKAALGQNAFREFQIRGMGRSTNWIAYNSAGSPPWINYTDSRMASDQTYLMPLIIDPQMVAVGNAASQDAVVASFPAAYAANNTANPSYAANPPPGPVIRRLGLTSNAAISSATAVPPYSYQPSRPLSDAIFTAADDVLTNRADDSSRPGTSALIYADAPYNTLPLKRDYGGQFSWLAVLSPISSNQLNPVAATQCTLSIVILNRRMLISPVPATDEQGQEEMVQVHWPTFSTPPSSTQDSTINTAGGEFTLTDTGATGNATGRLGMVQPNQWIMLCRYLPYTSSSGSSYPWIETKWYRVVAVGDVVVPTTPSAPYTRQVTLAGPDWEADPTAAAAAVSGSTPPALPNTLTWPSAVPSASQNYNTYAVLIDGAVGVYQRVIHLNSASTEWGQ